MLPLDVYPTLVFRASSSTPPVPFHGMPCWARSFLSCLFSSARVSLSRDTILKFSLRRKTSCSRALIYSSFLSRCVRCACLFNSCLLVNAGLLSGFGPLLFGGWPSTRVLFFSVKFFRNPRLIESGLFPLSDWLPYPLPPADLLPY